MLARQNRLTSDKDFSRLFRSGRYFDGRSLGLKAVVGVPGKLRVGFAVGVKVSKRATVRNRLKRRLREIVRKTLPLLPPGYDLVFLAKPGSADLEFAELEKLVAGLLARSGLLPCRSTSTR